jgi:hypothetical protein
MTMTIGTMKQNGGSARWVFGLFVAALVLLPVSWLGARWARGQHDRVRSQAGIRAWEQRREIWIRQWTVLEGELQKMGPLPFKMSEEAAVLPTVVVPDDLGALLQRTAGSALAELERAFPDEQQGVQLKLTFRPERTAGTWTALSKGIPLEAARDPGQHRLFGGSFGNDLEVIFRVPGEVAGGSVITALQTFFLNEDLLRSASSMSTVPLPVGVRGHLDMEFLIKDEGPVVTGWMTLATVLDRLGVLGLILLVLTPPLWVFVDARRRRLPAALWGLFALPTNVLGALIYALVNRDEGATCPECGERVSPRFVVCPYCQSQLKGTCPHCGQTVVSSWNYCPSCAKEL